MPDPAASLGAGQRLAEQQRRQQHDEQRQALRALLMQPLMGPQHEALPLVRRHAEHLQHWFRQTAGWPLRVDRDGARLQKRPADTGDATRGLPGFDRQRYVLLCLAAAVLERAEAQISLRGLGERLLQLAADPTLAARGFAFALQTQVERRALVHVCRLLLDLGVLHRVAGDEEGYVQGLAQQQGDALYDLRRHALAGLLAAVRGPSSWPAAQAPVSFDERLASLVAENVMEGDEAERQALRQRLARRLLDDPVVYLDELPASERAYFVNQRGALAARLAEATGLVAEQRAEGTALTDDGAELSDLALPAEGTEAHATLLVAEHLAARLRAGASAAVLRADVAAFLATARQTHGRFWRKAAREPGGEHALAAAAVQRLLQLQLVRVQDHTVLARPALARYELGEVQTTPRTLDLFGP
jgi:uncharacterized protein (TIGR02678 family)